MNDVCKANIDIPYSIQKKTFITDGEYSSFNRQVFSYRLQFKYNPFPNSLARAGLFHQLNFKNPFQPHHNWLTFYGRCGSKFEKTLEDKLYDDSKPLEVIWHEWRKRDRPEYEKLDPRTTSQFACMHNEKLMNEFNDA